MLVVSMNIITHAASLPRDPIAGDALVPGKVGKLADEVRLLQLLFGLQSLPKANSIRKYRDTNGKRDSARYF